MNNHKKFLILGFSPGLGVFLNAIAKNLRQRGVSTKLIGEVAMSKKVPAGLEIEPAVLAKVIEYENKFYNPENNPTFRKQIENYATRCLYHLQKIFKQNNFTDLLVWNGRPIFCQAGIYWAKQYNIKIWYMENGALPNTLQLDEMGVNAASSIAEKDRDFFIRHGLSYSVNSSSLIPLPYSSKLTHPFEMFMRYINRFGWYWSITRIFWRNFLPDQRGKSLRKNLPPDKIQLPEKFVFVPLQVQDDTQILMYSPLVKNMKEFVGICIEATKQVDPSLKIVVKEHPQDFGRSSYKELQQKYPSIIWLKKYPINDILKKASVVITINSGVGIEALTFNKPVITLGQAFYNVEGLVKNAKNLQELPQLIKDSITKPVDTLFIDKYLGYLQKRCFIQGGWKKFSQRTLDEIADRLLKSEVV